MNHRLRKRERKRGRGEGRGRKRGVLGLSVFFSLFPFLSLSFLSSSPTPNPARLAEIHNVVDGFELPVFLPLPPNAELTDMYHPPRVYTVLEAEAGPPACYLSTLPMQLQELVIL